MSSLVPQEAIDAANGVWSQGGYPDDVLEVVTPIISADTLRWAASRARKEHAAKFAPRSLGAALTPLITPTQLEEWANELEAGEQG